MAISVLYDNYSAAIYGVILRVVRCEHTAEDVMQECFVKIWTSILSYDPLKARLFTWLIRIARNAAIDALRSAHYRMSLGTCDIKEITFDGNNAIHTSFNPDPIGIRQLTQVLNTEQREVIDLLYFGGLTQTEAAEALNIPLGTVKNRSRTAISKLKKLFGPA
ncbi:RNA polymerase sigma-70 factor (ECF subfamily) [Pontibacter aydingkolensis]|uniref:RNA polymerase sigma factor n=1 Tax=Pontibacter aydingkolensis TaxID=1911536 RepID=A0ABS7CVF8_9BACT|nr:RNA polymerase sigma factor [Pontibacter aydingkolensis]MBW7467799.1 RNA polymerase sigma factor [Pontibacter aydingkolensis]